MTHLGEMCIRINISNTYLSLPTMANFTVYLQCQIHYSAPHLVHHVLGSRSIHGEVRKVDVSLVGGWQLDLGLLRCFLQPLHGHVVLGHIHTLLNEMDDTWVSIYSLSLGTQLKYLLAQETAQWPKSMQKTMYPSSSQIPTSFLNSPARKLTSVLSKSSPPRNVSPLVDFTSNTPFWISRMEISKVPPPRSYTPMLRRR